MLKWPFFETRGIPFRNASRAIAVSLAISCMSSCKRDSSAGAIDPSGAKPAAGTNDTAWPPLKPRLLQNTGDACAIVMIPDESPRPALLLEGGPAKGGARNWLIVCDLPADLKSVPVACRRSGGLITGWAQPLSKLSSGLTLLTFAPAEPPALAARPSIPDERGVHAVRFELTEPLAEQALSALKSELETVRTEISDYDEKILTARDARTARPPMGRPGERMENPMAAMNDLQRSKSDAIRRRGRVEAKVQIPFQAIGASEVVAAENPKALEVAGRALENTLLVSDSGNVLACRWQGRWETLESIRSTVAQAGGKAESAEISISPQAGGKVQVRCAIKLMNGLPGGDFSLVAATQNDLEMMGGGTLEQRLERVERVPLTGSGDSLSASQAVSHSSKVTTRLWLKVFSGKAAVPVLDEVILLIAASGSSQPVPIWERPPSPLIKLPPTPADVPAGVLKESQTIAASGTIRDLVPAGDGSILMIQTDRAPFWAALDLKSGKWLDMPWKAAADTLLASRAGKIHLVNKATGGIETWDLASGKREGTKLLQVELPITAVAAPLSNPEQPLIIADAKGIRFLDPADFHPVDIEDDLRDFLNPESVDPPSIWLRVSGDGAIYQLLGHAPNRDGDPVRKSMIVDSSWRSVPYGARSGFVSSGGRQFSADQAGTRLGVEIKDNGDRFPNQIGFLSIKSTDRDDGSKEVARLHSQRLYAAGLSQGRSRIPMADRRIYLDSRLGLLLAPAGDKLEWARIGLPDPEIVLPEFAFSGETLKIPLPPGSGHRMTAASSAKVEVGNRFASWTAPNDNSSTAGAFTLIWTGELGSEVSRDFSVRLLSPPRPLEVISPDGSKTLPLRPRGLLRGSDAIAAMAGSGEVAIRNDGSVWNLSDCQQLFKMKESGGYLGDAERAYSCSNGQTLTAYDLRSGQAIGSMPLGDSIMKIITGMSSRNPLLVVERVGNKGMLLQIPRELTRPIPVMTSAAPTPSDIEMQTLLLAPRTGCNASGSIFWDKGILISSNSGKVAVKVYPYQDYQGIGGTPDASGRIIVDTGAMLNLGFTPPRQVKFPELAGGEDVRGSLDASGLYLILSSATPNGQTGFISIREVTKPHVELLKIRYPYFSSTPPTIISATRTMCAYDGSMIRVYDLDIPKLAAQFGARQ